MSYFSKTAGPCESFWFRSTDRMLEQVDHCLYPNGSHCYFKRADICWRAERGLFQRSDESAVLDCSERGPHERMRTWQQGWKQRRTKARSNNQLLLTHVPFAIWRARVFAPYISACCLNSFDFNLSVEKNIFGNTFKETRTPLYLQYLLKVALIDQLCPYRRGFPLVCLVVWWIH